jgi:uncharacterized protein (TIGR02271 family)
MSHKGTKGHEMNNNNQTAIAGYFDNRTDAEGAVQDLRNAGFNKNDIDLAPYAGVAAGQYAGTDPYIDSDDYFDSADNTNEYAANHQGGFLVTVTGSNADQAQKVLERDGADISNLVNPGLANEGIQRIQLREERLSARKQNVQAGEVRIHKDVITEEKSIDVPVSHDEVVIERHPVTNRTVSDTPFGQDETIRVPLNREEVTLDKQAYVREEVEIGKRTVTETEHLSGTVRREEARIEDTGDVHVEGGDHRAEMIDDDTVDATTRR